ncbi:hypothetical protein NCER_102186 [Vairimorpha ceranae BRL01]|uniref:Uncharacterized protein n=2 Tax=Vairimorpha ceranae TaxID=40302 RepID=C4VBK8_VAIC1|nr:hypothetical protein AAJ76_3000011371 [Vairimorpha ceranae]EEQ81395.1 hypothetical protein NCER_102186 [Vairimorpha ceranae BRL01]KKO75143.1 hypothetical protein AAJ76_3000011371 [Vairimorpha ceranae]
MLPFKKTPKKILILNNIGTLSQDLKIKIRKFLPNSLIDFEENDIQYDLVFLLDYIFKFNLQYYKPISVAEIIFKRQTFDFKIFEEGLRHYSDCEIRNGV